MSSKAPKRARSEEHELSKKVQLVADQLESLTETVEEVLQVAKTAKPDLINKLFDIETAIDRIDNTPDLDTVENLLESMAQSWGGLETQRFLSILERIASALEKKA